MKTFHDLKTEADIIRFCKLDYKDIRPAALGAYFTNLFDLWEGPLPEISKETDDLLIITRGDVRDYAWDKYRIELDRDSEWTIHFNDENEILEILTS
jgi:hypothetical protein